MKRKFFVIIMTLLLCSTTILFVPSEISTDPESKGDDDYKWAKFR